MGNGYSYGCKCCPGPACCSAEPEEHNSLFRSEEMSLCQLFIQAESAHSVIAELGELGLVQFKDLNPELSAFQRKFVTEVRVCDEMERIIRFVEKEMRKEKIKPAALAAQPAAPAPREIRDLEVELNKLEGDLKEINGNREQLRANSSELTELQLVLNASHHFLEEASFQIPGQTNLDLGTGPKGVGGSTDIELGVRQADSMRLNFITGTIPSERIIVFERVVWRSTRGNVYLRHIDIATPLDDSGSGNPVRKAVFCLFFQGEQLKAKAKKLCEAFKCNIYTLPKTPAERQEMSGSLAQRITDIQVVLEKTDDHRLRLLADAATYIQQLTVKVLKTKAIYHTLNMFNMDVTQKCLIAECWCPVRDMDKIQQAIQDGTAKSGSEVPSVLNQVEARETIPTFNRVNKFTAAFQNINDAYGVSRYREINPALFSTITFPFIFSVMFGDCAHGLVMFLFALWMVIKEKQFMAKPNNNEIWGTFFGGRYIILFMGLFSMYTGWIYNDFFSKSINLFGSSWRADLNLEHEDEIHHGVAAYTGLDPMNSSQHLPSPHPFGLDPIWMISSNKITYTNSYKMKMSIILGITQMMFGLCLNLVNHIFFKNWSSIICEFVPELLFISALFGYMVVLIFVKWFTRFDPYCAPSILVGFINMFLFADPPINPGCEGIFILFSSLEQKKLVELILVITAVVCIPWLLCAKPAVIYIQRRMRRRSGFSHSRQQDTPASFSDINNEANGNGSTAELAATSQAESHDDEDEQSFGDVIVHQCIHTIEYCLGCVSNTASYLRLWALSLAHAQLSEVLWNMVMKLGLSIDSYLGAVLIIATLPFFAILTCAVLLLMEGLSAFLHALRLHWVEFNSKFFKGAGILFTPFNFKDTLVLSKEK